MMIGTRENRRTRWKTCSTATLSTTNPTWTDPGANPGLRVSEEIIISVIIYDATSQMTAVFNKFPLFSCHVLEHLAYFCLELNLKY
jgi:hypothetical protein